MISLLLAILSSALISVFMRLSSDKTTQNIGMLAMNYLTCLLLAAVDTGLVYLFPADAAMPLTLGLGIVQGIMYLLGFVLFQVSIKKNGVVLSAIFMKLGLLVPMVISILLFKERPTALQLLGFLFALGAILLINMEKECTAVSFKLGLILLLLCGGCADAMSKIYDELGSSWHSKQFLFYTFLAAFLLCLAFMFLKGQRVGRIELFYGVLIGIPNFFSARFLLKSLAIVPAVIAYPTFSVGTILIVAIAGIFLFRERLGNFQKWAVGIILVALALLNM